MENKHKVYNLIILDESGSMQSIKGPTISGFNEVVQTIKGVEKQFPDQEHLITLVSFNELKINTQLFNELASKLEEIDEEKYRPNSGTPLYDAMGFSMTKLRAEVEKFPNHNVLVTILTDGEENASKEYNSAAIKKLIDELKLKNWTFTYIGANHDVQKFAQSISITNTMTFQANASDMKKMFAKESRARVQYSSKISKKEAVSDDFYKDVD